MKEIIEIYDKFDNLIGTAESSLCMISTGQISDQVHVNLNDVRIDLDLLDEDSELLEGSGESVSLVIKQLFEVDEGPPELIDVYADDLSNMLLLDDSCDYILRNGIMHFNSLAFVKNIYREHTIGIDWGIGSSLYNEHTFDTVTTASDTVTITYTTNNTSDVIWGEMGCWT